MLLRAPALLHSRSTVSPSPYQYVLQVFSGSDKMQHYWITLPICAACSTTVTSQVCFFPIPGTCSVRLLSACLAPGTTSHAYPLPKALLLDLISLFELHKHDCCLWFPNVLFFLASFPCRIPTCTASPCLVHTPPIPAPSCLQVCPQTFPAIAQKSGKSKFFKQKLIIFFCT